jgi:hypothetical protein
MAYSAVEVMTMNQIDIYLELLKNTRDILSLPPNYISELESELDQYITNIKSCDTMEMSESALTALAPFQEKLAELSFRYHLPLSERLNTVVRYFDRPDDVEARRYFFKMVKEKF